GSQTAIVVSILSSKMSAKVSSHDVVLNRVAPAFDHMPPVLRLVVEQQHASKRYTPKKEPLGVNPTAPWELPGPGSTQMRPPWLSTIFVAMASPMPVLGYSLRWCRR